MTALRDRLPTLALVAAILVAWEAYVRVAGVAPVVLPSPTRILSALWEFRADAVRHAIPTLLETVVGFAIAVVLGIAAAVLMDRTPAVRRAVEPILVTTQTIPIVALAPLFLLWFGFGLLPKVLVVVLVTFFPIVVALLDGFRSASADAADLLRSYGATDWQAFRKLRWPNALPAFFTGLRISVVYAVIGAVFGEYVGAREGLGIWMQLAQNSFRTDLVFAAIVVTSAVSLTLYWVVGLLRRLVIPWAPGVRHEVDVEERPF
ncbi:MAG TPA: ABC transporter permease [Candidatus Limnocylindrales bacterium]|nr:ABC transporter permease [Candidatus Limnocylindrales bacterium]